MECLRGDKFQQGVILGGRYKTISALNHGSFGMVFMAKDLKTSENVAIKCLTKKTAATETFTDYAIDDKSEELTLHRRLGNHPNIVNLLDSFETESHSFLVIEYCPQGDLYEAIRRGCGPLETEHVRRFMLELVDAVAYMHANGIYHRDIKPENIFLTQAGSMKLGDFGLATTDRWSFEAAVGSDRYMSPEQYDSAGAGYSPAQADIWAIGICLLNILFSRNPFTIPAESDPLFLDFSRDKQSLFDVFPNMSQDTYEVIVQCMNLDPRKRSLVGARNALRRVVSFTTLEENLDDFCTADRRVVASSNREPLRTPSIQSPQVDNGAFPWAKALRAGSQKGLRQLSAIPDNESYSEDLFSKSGVPDWMSGSAQTPSMDSLLDSSLAASMQSLAIPSAATNKGQMGLKTGVKVPAVAGSLPITMTRPRPIQSAMSLVFGRKETVSKSWSDMWDEDIEEEEEQQRRQMQVLKEMNSRTWSHESKKDVDDDETPRQGLSPATKSVAPIVALDIPSIESAVASKDMDEDLAADGIFFLEQPKTPARYSPRPKRTPSSNVDKWTALGEARRRAHTGDSSPTRAPEMILNTGRTIGTDFKFGSLGNSHGVSDLYGNSHHNTYNLFGTTPSPSTQHSPNSKWGHHHDAMSKDKKDRTKDCPWNKGRDREWNWNFDWRKEKRTGFGDLEWVGGWQETHS